MFETTKKRRFRKSYEDRTGMSSRAAVILAEATIIKPETFEDEDGNVIRVWTNHESYTHSDIALVLANRVAVEAAEMLGVIPPRAIKYSVSKGWLVPNASATVYRVTLKGAIDLNLPMKFKGGQHTGRKIPFLNTTKAAVVA